MDNIESFEVGDNCVSYFQTDGMSEEEATKYCNGEQVGGDTLKGELNVNLEELKTNNVIKNVVTDGTIKITDYNIDIGGVDVVIPSTIDGKTVVAIGTSAFQGKVLSSETSMLNKSNIQFMSNKEDNEFAASQGPLIHGDIRSVVIPSTVKSIGDYAFAYNKISSVTLSNGLETIGRWAFSQNQLTNIIIPSSVNDIYTNALYKDSNSNPNLTKIINKTEQVFNWRNIINWGGLSNEYNFVTGTVEASFGNVEVTSE